VTEIIGSFWQGPRGNCTSIAFIKAVLRRYGGKVRDAFDSYAEAAGGIRVRTRGNSEYEVTSDELRKACQAFGVNSNVGPDYCAGQTPDPAKLYALLAKACEKRQSGSNECQLSEASFDAALERLDTGLLWKVPPELLDFKEGDKGDYHILTEGRVSRWFHIDRFTSGGGACVVASPWHSFFVTSGYFDRYGTPVRFSHRKGINGLWANHAYCLDAPPTITTGDELEASDADHKKAESEPQLVEDHAR
jgi:hypothetical protein